MSKKISALTEATSIPDTGYLTFTDPAQVVSDQNRKISGANAAAPYLQKDGSVELTADWDAGAFKITAETLVSDVTTGTAPFSVASTTKVTNLNADQLDGLDLTDVNNPDFTTFNRSSIAAVANELNAYEQKVHKDIAFFTTSTPTVTLTTTGAGDLATAVAALTDGDILEIQVSATYSAVVFPTATRCAVRVAPGYDVQVQSGTTAAIQFVDGCADIFVSGLTFESNTYGSFSPYVGPYSQGTDIGIAHQAKVSNITIHNCKFYKPTGASIIIGYHQSTGGDVYDVANAANEFSDHIAFVDNHLFEASNESTEGAGMVLRGVDYAYIYNNIVDTNSKSRGIQIQNCTNFLISNNKVNNAATAAEGIKIDRIGSPAYYSTGFVVSNVVKNCGEGIDIDDYVYAVVTNNIAYDCTISGIGLDNNSIGMFVGNITHSNVDGIRAEAGSIIDMYNNVSFNNSSNDYRMDNSFAYNTSNTTDIENCFISGHDVPFDPASISFTSLNVQDAINELKSYVDNHTANGIFTRTGTDIAPTNSGDNVQCNGEFESDTFTSLTTIADKLAVYDTVNAIWGIGQAIYTDSTGNGFLGINVSPIYFPDTPNVAFKPRCIVGNAITGGTSLAIMPGAGAIGRLEIYDDVPGAGGNAMWAFSKLATNACAIEHWNGTSYDDALNIDTSLMVSLSVGTSVNEFSTDGTLADDSDDALPTEKAVKAYVDNHTANGLWTRNSLPGVPTIGTTNPTDNVYVANLGVANNLPVGDVAGGNIVMQGQLRLGVEDDAGDAALGMLAERISDAGTGATSSRIMLTQVNGDGNSKKTGISFWSNGYGAALPSGMTLPGAAGAWGLVRHNNSVDGGAVVTGSVSDNNLTFTGSLSSSVAPTLGDHLTNKTYVDNVAKGLDWQESVKDEVNFVTSEPSAPSVGDRYINTTTGVSSGTSQAVTANYIYQWTGALWDETIPDEGTALWVEDVNSLKVYNSSSWVDLGTAVSHNALSGLQGGTTNEYYHLTAAAHTYASAMNQGVATTNSPSFVTVNATTQYNVNSTRALWFKAADNNLFVGNSGKTTATGTWNIFVSPGFTGTNLSTGNENTAMGGYSLSGITSGIQNAAFGFNALRSITTTLNNAALGAYAGYAASVTSNNVFVGATAGYSSSMTSENVLIGSSVASSTSDGGSGNVVIGFNAGNGFGAFSNKLYIANSNTATPLISGDFSSNLLNINGSLGIGINIPITTLHLGNTAINNWIRLASPSTGGSAGIEFGFNHATEKYGNFNITYDNRFLYGLAAGTSSSYPITFNTIDSAGAVTSTRVIIKDNGFVGINTTGTDKQLEINSSTGSCLRLTYDDDSGSATYYTDYAVTSDGNATITPSGGAITLTSTLSVTGAINGVTVSNGPDAFTLTVGASSLVVDSGALSGPSQIVMGNLIIVSSVPGSNPPANKHYLYENASGQIEARGASGTITVLAGA